MNTTGYNDVICSKCQMARLATAYRVSYDDPRTQICDECKADDLVRRCISAIKTLDVERRLQIVRAFLKQE